MSSEFKEKLERIVKDDSDKLCKFCKFEDDCPKCVVCYGGEPSFPPCSDGDLDFFINFESVEEYEEDVEEIEGNVNK